MSIKERAHSLIDMMTEEDTVMFINLIERLYYPIEKKQETVNEEQDLIRRREAFEKILAMRPNGSVVVDDKQELLDYLDERYGITK